VERILYFDMTFTANSLWVIVLLASSSIVFFYSSVTESVCIELLWAANLETLTSSSTLMWEPCYIIGELLADESVS
jgi:hypothetical protein